MRDKTMLINNGIDINKSLELFGDMEMYDETLSEFLESVDDKVNSLTLYKENSDMHNYAILAHSLKSDARYLGFTKLAELSLQHEIAGKDNNVDFVYSNFDDLIKEVKRIISVVCTYMGVNNNVKINDNNNTISDDKVILVVDDSNLVQNFVKKMFDNSYKVIVASDGNEAINTINSDVNSKIIGMLLDLNMPNVDGFAVLDYMDKNNLFDKVPVAIITGVDTKDDISKAFMYPIIDVINKPFNEKNIKKVIERMINKITY